MMRVIKKLLLIICTVCLVVLTCGAVACAGGSDNSGNTAGDTVHVISVQLNKEELQLDEGASQTLIATVLPSNATNTEVTWASSNPGVASVDNSGKVTAVSAGETNISATADGKSAICKVTVKGSGENVPVQSVTLSKTQLNLEVGDVSEKLVATVAPENATDKTVTWTSSNESVATVKDGVVAAKKDGSAIITATAGGKSATCTVTVSVKNIPVKSISLNKSSAIIEVGSTEVLTAEIDPFNATNATVNWTSSDESVATDSGGAVNALKAGTTNITATAGGKSAKCVVTVKQTVVKVTGITVTPSEIEIEEDETYPLSYTITPSDATDKTVTWTSSDESVATVSKGVVTAVKDGTAIITATAGGKSAKCTVTVTAKYRPVTDVILNIEGTTIKVNSTLVLEAEVVPENATYKTVTWTSSDEKVATVSEGTVKALSTGTATITATADNISATCVVTVSENVIEVTSLVLNRTSLELNIPENFLLTATVGPENATDKTVTWRSSNTSVATVDNGMVVAVGKGNATITATAGKVSATCDVTVSIPRVEVESITLNKNSLELKVEEIFTLTYEINPHNATDNEVIWTSDHPEIATVKDGLVTAVSVGTAMITASVGGKSASCEVAVVPKEDVGGGGEDNPPAIKFITYAHAGEESAVFEWTDSNAAGANVGYKLSSSSIYTNIDSELVRQISADKARADILGLKGGEKYDFKITASDGKIQTVQGVNIASHDRSGYAHVGVSDGVGAYNNDGTLKSGAKVIYLTEKNKNDIDGKGTSIAEYLSAGSSISTPVVIRIIGTVGCATWNRIEYNEEGHEGDDITVDKVVGMDGKKHLPTDHKDITQKELLDGDYNTLNYYPEKLGGDVYCAYIDGLTSKATYKDGKYDSMWNDCQVVGAKNITVEGVGEDAEIFQWGFTFKTCNSIEVRNLRFFDYTEDACSFEGDSNTENSTKVSGFNTKNFWVHHNVFDIGMNYWDVCPEQDKHDGDGATDFKFLAYVTLAYNQYNNTHKTGLVGGDNKHHQACFTFHHNYYNGCDQRMPLGRQANMHMYNNYYSGSGLYSISLRARAYAYIENCVFTSNPTRNTTPIVLEQTDGDEAGIPSAKVVNCEIEGKIKNNFSDIKNLVQSKDAETAEDVAGGNHYGLNFEKSLPYTVTSKMELSKVKTDVPKLAGTLKHDNNIEIDGGSQEEDPPYTPDDVTMSIFNAVHAGKMRLSSDNNDKQDFTDLSLTSNISFTANRTTVTENAQTFDDGRTFTCRVILGAISANNQRYFKITTGGAATIKVYVANKGDGTRNIGLYTDKDNTNNSLIGTKSGIERVTTPAPVVEISVTAAGTYYLISTDGDLSVYAIDIAEGGGSTTTPTEKKTYTYTYGGNNGDEWAINANEETNPEKPAPALKLVSGSSLTLTAVGTKITVSVKGFTMGTSNTSEWLKVTLKAADGTELGTLNGTTTSNKALGNYVFPNNGVLTAAAQFATVEITFIGPSDKSTSITEVKIEVE